MKHTTLLFAVAAMCTTSLAFADAGADAGADADVDAAIEDASAAPVPLACDGALCDTTNNGTCDVAPNRPDFPSGTCAMLFGLSTLVAGVLRRARKESSR